MLDTDGARFVHSHLIRYWICHFKTNSTDYKQKETFFMSCNRDVLNLLCVLIKTLININISLHYPYRSPAGVVPKCCQVRRHSVAPLGFFSYSRVNVQICTYTLYKYSTPFINTRVRYYFTKRHYARQKLQLEIKGLKRSQSLFRDACYLISSRLVLFYFCLLYFQACCSIQCIRTLRVGLVIRPTRTLRHILSAD